MLLLGAAGAFAGTSHAELPPPATPPPTPTPSVVYRMYEPHVIERYHVDAAMVRTMVDRLLLATTGQPDVPAAWRSLVAPNDRIGIKISAAGGELFATHRAVVNALVDGLAAAGHPRANIIVWDRNLTGIKAAGYRPETEGYQLRSIGGRDGYDAKAVFTSPYMGKLIWGDLDYLGDRGGNALLSESENLSNVSHFCRILVSEVTKVINVPVLTDSAANGLAGCLENMTVPNVDNWRRFGQPPDFGAAGIAEIYANPMVGRKVIFNLMDGLLAQYAGGPEAQPNYALHYGTLFASRDPVALDAVAVRTLDPLRAQSKLPPIGKRARHIETAAQLGLGNADAKLIDVRNLGR